MDLAEDFDSPICLAYTTAKIVTIFKNVIPCSWQRYSWKLMLLTQLNLKSFKKKKEASSSCHALHWPCFVYHVMLCFGYALFWPCHAYLDKICTKDKNSQLYNWFPTFWRQKGEIYYSPITIHLSLFIRYYSWHCSLRIFAYLRGVVRYVWIKFYFRSSSLERVPSSEL